jgi:hypothetical protein
VLEATAALQYEACGEWFKCKELRRGGFSAKLRASCYE